MLRKVAWLTRSDMIYDVQREEWGCVNGIHPALPVRYGIQWESGERSYEPITNLRLHEEDESDTEESVIEFPAHELQAWARATVVRLRNHYKREGV